MKRIRLYAFLSILALVVAISAIVPPEKKLKLGKDLRGGVSLVYGVSIKEGENSKSIMEQTIRALKDRVDPSGLREISFIAQGKDRLEITMPMPDPRAKAKKQALDDLLSQIAATELTESKLDQALRLSDDRWNASLDKLSGGLDRRRELLVAARAAMIDHSLKTQEYKDAQAGGADATTLATLVDRAGAAAEAFDKARDLVMKSVLSASEVSNILQLSNEPRFLANERAKTKAERNITIPGDRDQAIKALREKHPEATDQIDHVLQVFAEYEKEGSGVLDAQDLIRTVKGAGVLSFRITVDPLTAATGNTVADEPRLREELRKRGPANVRSTEARWYKVNKIHNWYDSVDQYQYLQQNPEGFFASRGYVGDIYNGEYYLLAWDKRGLRLTQDEGDWSVASAYEDRDHKSGRPAIAFVMDSRGSQLLGELTAEPSKTHEKMAVLLDDQVYTAPSLQSSISRSGQITGDFSQEELDYIIRVLAAGSLSAKLSPEPLSQSIMAPALGRDNLIKGLQSGVVAFGVCAVFLIGYYFFCGLIATVALIVNVILLLGAMSLNHAAFTLPGIAGVILALAMAVDANVLVYERMREEMERGATLKEGVRLGYSRAMTAIVDGNLTHMIVCSVLLMVGTPEIRGFAISMVIGVVTTLFSQLLFTRLIFDVLVEKFHWKRAHMLPTVVPAVQRAMTLNINWLRMRGAFTLVFGALVLLSTAIFLSRGSEILDTEFRGGTSITLQLKETAPGQRMTMTRAEVDSRLQKVADERPSLKDLRSATVVVLNPRNDGITSDTFKIKTVVTRPDDIKQAISGAFGDVIDTQPKLSFNRADATEDRLIPAYPITERVLGENIGDPDVRNDVQDFQGGVAVVLADLRPAPTLAQLRARLDSVRQRPEYAASVRSGHDIIVTDGDETAVRGAVLLTLDADLSYFDDPTRWENSVREREWALAKDALTEATTFMGVESFSPAIAATFVARAVASGLIASLLVTIFVWVRFQSLRFAAAAIVPTLMDCFIAVGFLSAAEIVYDNATGFATTIGLMPFKIDLNVVAAILTVLGYSINDKIVLLDRIRENRGKLKYISRTIVNDSINQCMSRTLMTGTTTILSTIVLYFMGGETVKPFAYALGLGVITGTLSSVMIGAPMVWSRKGDEQNPAKPGKARTSSSSSDDSRPLLAAAGS
jgi:SecD/SecF fusion protein